MLYLFLELRCFRMKNRLLVLGMLVMALVFGMAVVGCDDGNSWFEEGDGSLHRPMTDGRLTITGLDEYNGKFVRADGHYNFTPSPSSPYLAADGDTIFGVEINNGQVTLKVWSVFWGESSIEYFGYNKNETIKFTVSIATKYSTSGASYESIGEVTVTFVNGIGTGSFVKKTTP
jgi:hypothetical protein